MIVCLFQDTLLGQGAALALFVAAALSDYLDGRLARMLKADSRLGRFLDPMADKVLVLGTFLALAFLRPELVPWWAVAVIAGRDITVTLLRTRAEARGQSIRTVPVAKLKTMMQLAFLIALLVLLTGSHLAGALGVAADGVLASSALVAALVAVVVVTVATGLWYVFNSEFIAPPDS